MAKRKGQLGRPTKINADVINKMEQAFSLDASIDEMCLFAGITPQTYYNFIKKWPDLLERFTALRNRPVLKARNTVVGALGEPIHAFKYLEKKRRAEFGEKIAVEHSGKVENEIGVTSEVKEIIDEFDKKLREKYAQKNKEDSV